MLAAKMLEAAGTSGASSGKAGTPGAPPNVAVPYSLVAGPPAAYKRPLPVPPATIYEGCVMNIAVGGTPPKPSIPLKAPPTGPPKAQYNYDPETDPWAQTSEEDSGNVDHSMGFPPPKAKAPTTPAAAGFSQDPWQMGQSAPDCILHRGRWTNIATLHFEGQVGNIYMYIYIYNVQ